MICKLTGEEGKGIGAHIIPKSFYEFDPSEKKTSRIYTNTEGIHTQKTAIGIYDKTIVTEAGERLFAGWDDYAAELLLARRDEFSPLVNKGEIVGYEIKDYDFIKLKLFVLSVLWRADASSSPFFGRIKLGPHEKRIRNILLSGELENPDVYDVTLARWTGDMDGTGMIDPHRSRLFGHNYYLLYLGNYMAYIKVDKVKSKNIYSQLQLFPERPLKIIARDFEGSKEMTLMINLIKAKTTTPQ